MNQEIEKKIEQLKLKNSRDTINFLGRLLVDTKELTIWEHDTKTLPRGARKWRKRARKFARENFRPIASIVDRDPESFDPGPLIKKASKKGFQTLMLPFPVGRASILTYLQSITLQIAVVAEELATECGGLALLLLAHNLGIAPILLAGDIPAVIRFLLPEYIKANLFGSSSSVAYAITEPEAGSDVETCEGGATARLNAVARPVKGGYILNGQKCFISNGAIADRITFFAKLEGEGIESWTCFLINKSMNGVSVGRHERKMGQKASDASEIILDNVFVPKKNVIGKLRSGWAINHNVLNFSRPAVGAMALGHGRGAFERALEYCRNTKLGTKRLIDYKDVQYELADMMTSLWSARSLIWQSCRQLGAYQSLSSAVKVCASDTAVKVCNQAMELMGDDGYLHIHGVERAWRDSRLTQIYEGTNQINRYDIIEHQWDAEINRNPG